MRDFIIYTCLAIGVALFFLGCGDTYVYNVELNECSCSQEGKNVKIVCSDFEVTFKNSKCTIKENE